jgi:ER membrane protein complex subunit 2
MHARLGEVQYIASNIGGSACPELSSCSYLIDSFRRFCRSIELCNGYLRGYYGLKLVRSTIVILQVWTLLRKAQASNRILSLWPHITRQLRPEDGILLPDVQTIQLLNQRATEKLSEIIRRSAGGEKGWEGYEDSELIAAREILNRDTKPLVH